MFSRAALSGSSVLHAVYTEKPLGKEDVLKLKRQVFPFCFFLGINPEDAVKGEVKRINEAVEESKEDIVSVFLYRADEGAVNVSYRHLVLSGIDGETAVRCLTSYDFLFDSLVKWLFGEETEPEKVALLFTLHGSFTEILKKLGYAHDLIVPRSVFTPYGEGFKVFHRFGSYLLFRFRKESPEKEIRSILEELGTGLLLDEEKTVREIREFEKSRGTDTGLIVSLDFSLKAPDVYLFEADFDDSLLLEKGEEIGKFALYSVLLSAGLKALNLSGRRGPTPVVFKKPESGLWN